MSRRPTSTYLAADELKQIAAIKFNEAHPRRRQSSKKFWCPHAGIRISEMKRYLASKELEPPK
jgi:hypothetical protein